MKNNKFLVTFLIATLSLTTTSCSNDFLDVNDDPNNIQAELITPKQILPGAMSNAYRTQGTTMVQFGGLMMNSWGANSYSFGGAFAREFNLATVDNTFYNGIWNIYPRIANFAQIERYPNGDHKQDNYIAIAKIMKAFYMQYIVDLYGDAPYSEAFLGIDNLTPKYDNDTDIYKSLITSLEQANALMDAKHESAEAASTDIVFKGDMGKWKEFSNTLMLRLLVRMSKVTGELETYRNQKLTALAARVNANLDNKFIESEVTVNPGYSASNDDQMNPYGLNWYRNASATLVSNNGVVVVSEHMANALEGNLNLNDANYTKFTGLLDPRRTRLFTAVTGGVRFNGAAYTGLKGVRQGAVPGQPGAPVTSVNTSKLATGNFAGSAVATTSWYQIIDANNARGGVIMSQAESNLLQAEAALRWPTIFGTINAQAKFDNAILTNATWLGANTANAAWTNYITGIATKPGLGWAGTNQQKIEAIMTQKWIALTNVNPTEMFIEYLRTGYPYTPMAVTAQHANKPYRLVYPFSEYSANPSNTPVVTSNEVFTKNPKTPFWNQN